jgi:hypothetical protein
VCEPGFVPRVSLQVGVLGAVPQRAGGVGFVPGYRVEALSAEREAASMSACLAGAPQRRATAEHRAGKTPCCAACCRPRAPEHNVEHLIGEDLRKG